MKNHYPSIFVILLLAVLASCGGYVNREEEKLVFSGVERIELLGQKDRLSLVGVGTLGSGVIKGFSGVYYIDQLMDREPMGISQ